MARIKGCISRQFPATVLTLIPVGVALNLALGTLVQVIKLPLFLDTSGTVFIAVLCGSLPAITTGVITVLVGGLVTNPVLPWFVVTAIAIGWFAGLCANAGAFKSLWLWSLCGLLTGVIAAIVSAPVIVYLFGGLTQSGSSFVVAFLLASGETLLTSVLLAGVSCDPVDKLLTFLIVWGLVKGLPRNLKAQFPRGIQNTEAEAAKSEVATGNLK